MSAERHAVLKSKLTVLHKPIHQRVSRYVTWPETQSLKLTRNPRKQEAISRNSAGLDIPPDPLAPSGQFHLPHHCFRLPSQGFIFLIISVEFGAYVLTRQVVNVFEWLVAWRGYKRHLRLNLRNAKTYEEWAEAAKKLDNYLGFDEWKGTEEDSYFDHTLVSGSTGGMLR